MREGIRRIKRREEIFACGTRERRYVMRGPQLMFGFGVAREVLQDRDIVGESAHCTLISICSIFHFHR
jgi:hypothetical protein